MWKEWISISPPSPALPGRPGAVEARTAARCPRARIRIEPGRRSRAQKRESPQTGTEGDVLFRALRERTCGADPRERFKRRR